VARFLLLFVVPVSLVWVPVFHSESGATISLLDLWLSLLWPLAAWYWLITPRVRSNRFVLPLLLVSLAPGFLAAFGVFVSKTGSDYFLQISLHMKRMGLAAVIPLAVFLFGSRSYFRRIRYSALACLGAMALFSFLPSLTRVLPVARDSPGGISPERAAGLITNPNDAAYVAVGLLAILTGLNAHVTESRFTRALTNSIGIAAALLTIALSGSRSGLLGLVIAAGYYVVSAKASTLTKTALILALAVTFGMGLQLSDLFRDRMHAAYAERLGEPNVAARVLAQQLAILTAYDNPLGIGFTHFREVYRGSSPGVSYFASGTSDSVFFDTLLAAGVAGLAAVLYLYYVASRYISSVSPVAPQLSSILRAGLIAMCVFGTASVVPSSPFVSPTFYLLVGCPAIALIPATLRDRRGPDC